VGTFPYTNLATAQLLGYRRCVAHEVPPSEHVRAAEVIAALCLGTDLGMGLPFEHGLRTTLIAMRLGDRIGVDDETASQTYYASLLSYSGCTADAEILAEIFGGSLTTNFAPRMMGSRREVIAGIARALPDPASPPPVRAIQIARRLPRAARENKPHVTAICEVAQMLATRLGLPTGFPELFLYLVERWDGKSPLGQAKGEEIPLAIRIAHVAQDAALQEMLGGEERAARVVRERAGQAHDPEIAARFADDAAEILALDPDTSVCDEVLACEPHPQLTLTGEAIDGALAAMGAFADLISPHFAGHSAGVAELAAAAATHSRLDSRGEVALRRAALVHDVGRVAVWAKTWEKPGPLNADEWEQVRLHPYQTERVLSRSQFLAALAPIAGAHHERLDRSGYHRGVAGADLNLPARLLATADVFHALTEPRPYRQPISPDVAAETLAAEASAGRLDPDCVNAVLEAAGQRVPRIERPAGLTEREAEVVGLLARGLQTKQIAHALDISVKTADRHVQNAYGKIGVSTRAAATLFAMEHGLVAWGELPIVGREARP
jgi:HD-GYP domain-containing protein (c-di-GMP phosphodiesterase class II)